MTTRSTTRSAGEDARWESLTAIALRHGREHPDRACIHLARAGARQTIAWGEFAARVRDLLVGLDALGLDPGDVVGTFCLNRWEFLALDLALMGRGLVVLALHEAWSEARVRRVLEHARVRALFTEAAYLPRFAAHQRALPALKTLVCIDDDAPVEGVERIGHLLDVGRERCAAGGAIVDERLAIARSQDTATLIHIGGSTSEIKAVIRTHGNLVSRGWSRFPWDGDPGTGDEVVLNPSNYVHAMGRRWNHTAIAAGCAVALPSKTEALTLADLQLFSPTHVPAHLGVIVKLQHALLPQVGGLWEKIERASSDDPQLPALRREFAEALGARTGGRLRMFQVPGGGAVPPKVFAFFDTCGGIRLRAVYGHTEIGAVAAQHVGEFRPGTLGRPASAELRFDEGEILVRGAGVSPGYLGNPAATAQALDADGWWRTGMLGRLDDDGYLVVLGRKSQSPLFLCNDGTSIDPTEIERLLEADPLIEQAILIGNRRPFLGALLVVDRASVRAQAAADDDRAVERLIETRIADVNQDLDDYERIRKFLIVDGFSAAVRPASGSPATIDRAAVEREFGPAIERLYAD